MFGVGVGELFLVAVVCGGLLVPAVIVTVVRFAASRNDEAGRPPGVVEAMRHGRATSAAATVGFVVALLVGAVSSLVADSGRGLAFTPLVASFVALCCLGLGELLGRRGRSPLRTTALNARTARDVATGGWLRGGTLAVAGLAGVALAAGVSADRLRGRVIAKDLVGAARWGFPGWETLAPQLAGLVVVVVTWVLAVRVVVLRPTVADADVEVDNALRRASAARATRAALAGVLLAVGVDLLRAGSWMAQVLERSDGSAAGVALLGGVLALVAPLLLLLPSVRLPRAAALVGAGA